MQEIPKAPKSVKYNTISKTERTMIQRDLF